LTTERLQLWRSRDLNPNFSETLDKIGEFGWQTWSVFANETADNFAYTVGVFDTLGLPELITVGLPVETGAQSLNRAVAFMRKGVDLSKGRFRDIVGKVEVEFLPIDPKWLHHLMLRTDWYYEGTDVPVLQLVFPDLENRFQWEDGFTDHFRQPMLAPGYPEQDLEGDLWDSHDRSIGASDWNFADPPQTRALFSQSVQNDEEPITYATRDDGEWLFLGDQMTDGAGPVRSRLSRALRKDPTLADLADLPVGWCATRSIVGAPWERFERGPEDLEDEEN
jgi:hypothetical protein